MRPWILLKHYAIPFEETLVKLDTPTTTSEILKFSPAGRVPVLIDGELVVWDSLAIMEYLAEKFPQAKMWPVALEDRARARAVSAEMHSGFQTMREKLSFHATKRFTVDLKPVAGDIERVQSMWAAALKASRGPFLFGEFSIADAMFAPVAGRFQTYSVPMSGEVAAYCERVLALPAVREWYAGAQAEDFVVGKYEK